VIDDGTYAKIYEKWFHHEPPEEIKTASHEAT
jgi:ABC-type amino acid transport substrate-binding protein